MIFRTADDEFYNLSHYHKFHVHEGEIDEGWCVTAELIPQYPHVAPFDEVIATADSRDDAVELLSEIMRRMSRGWDSCSHHEIREEINRPSTPVQEVF